jgi:transposase InsO family protein
MWGIDTTIVTDALGTRHIVLGAIDHGSRLNLMLQQVKRFNSWTFLGCLFLAIGRFGPPAMIKTDNHPVFRSAAVKMVLRWCGIGLRHSRPARPWENGYIERLFGTFKRSLAGYVINDACHLRRALPAFQFWYNVCRPHQHLGGQTPQQAWLGIDPWKTVPRSARSFSAWGGRLRGIVLRH